jgi:beta-galactosidase
MPLRAVNQPYEFTVKAKTDARLNPPFDIPENNDPIGSCRKKFHCCRIGMDGRLSFIRTASPIAKFV